jgi:hypothetical protein
MSRMKPWSSKSAYTCAKPSEDAPLDLVAIAVDRSRCDGESAGLRRWPRSGNAAELAAKVCLAAPVSGTTAARDAIAAIRLAIAEAERLLGHALLEDCLDRQTGELTPLTIVTDNGPAYKSLDFLRFIAGRPELAHVRTRHHAPETNGVVERFNGSLKYEHLHRHEIADALDLADHAEAFRTTHNEVRPHESLDFATPLSHYLADPVEPHLFQPESVQES